MKTIVEFNNSYSGRENVLFNYSSRIDFWNNYSYSEPVTKPLDIIETLYTNSIKAIKSLPLSPLESVL